MGKELLFEIGTEEIPSAYMPGLLRALEERARALLGDLRLDFSGLEVLGTPRRLVLHVADLAERQKPLEEEILGPPVKAAFDKEGKPTKAALGFARTHGADPAALGRKDTPKGERLVFVKKEKGKAAAEILSEKLLANDLTLSLPLPKSMKWETRDETIKFVRPIRWFLGLYGGRVIPHLLANPEGPGTTRGHRFMAPEAFEVKSFQDYIKKLYEHFVEPIVDDGKGGGRIPMVRKSLGEAAEGAGGEPAASAEAVGRLIEKVAFLVEWPVPVPCAFDRRFLDLPEEVIITTLEVNQRCFALREREGGALLPDFVGFSNTDPERMGKGRGSRRVIARGYERVVRARLEDAEFYWKSDLRTPLEAMAEKLKGVVYHPRLGTSWEKVGRFRALAGWLAGAIFPGEEALAERVDAAARLCKADLTSGMVGEFPELQGAMGRRYAERAGREPAVCRAIFEHYLPRGEGDALPSADEGAIVGLADRMDTIAGLVGLGYLPSGSEDPYALRRAANAILQILIGRGYGVSLPAWAGRALEPLHDKLKDGKEEVTRRVCGFLRGRLGAFLGRGGARADLVEAVLSASGGAGWHDPVDARARLGVLERLAGREEAFEPLATTFKRVSHIIRQAAEKGEAGFAGEGGAPSLSPGLFEEEAERALAGAVEKRAGEVERSLAPVRGPGRRPVEEIEDAYGRAMESVVALRPLVDRFFDDVLVMAEDERIRRNRLALLAEVGGLFAPVADFAKIQGPASR